MNIPRWIRSPWTTYRDHAPETPATDGETDGFAAATATEKDRADYMWGDDPRDDKWDDNAWDATASAWAAAITPDAPQHIIDADRAEYYTARNAEADAAEERWAAQITAGGGDPDDRSTWVEALAETPRPPAHEEPVVQDRWETLFAANTRARDALTGTGHADQTEAGDDTRDFARAEYIDALRDTLTNDPVDHRGLGRPAWLPVDGVSDADLAALADDAVELWQHWDTPHHPPSAYDPANTTPPPGFIADIRYTTTIHRVFDPEVDISTPERFAAYHATAQGISLAAAHHDIDYYTPTTQGITDLTVTGQDHVTADHDLRDRAQGMDMKYLPTTTTLDTLDDAGDSGDLLTMLADDLAADRLLDQTPADEPIPYQVVAPSWVSLSQAEEYADYDAAIPFHVVDAYTHHMSDDDGDSLDR